MPTFTGKLDLVPFSIYGIFKKAPFGHHFRSKRLQSSSTPVEGERPCRDPAFRETIVITVPLGHRCFLKYIFPIEIGSFVVLGVFPAAMFCATFFIPSFHITSVNAESLSPPILK